MKRNGQSNHEQQNVFLSDFSAGSVRNNCTVMGNPNIFQFWRNVFIGKCCRWDFFDTKDIVAKMREFQFGPPYGLWRSNNQWTGSWWLLRNIHHDLTALTMLKTVSLAAHTLDTWEGLIPKVIRNVKKTGSKNLQRYQQGHIGMLRSL